MSINQLEIGSEKRMNRCRVSLGAAVPNVIRLAFWCGRIFSRGIIRMVRKSPSSCWIHREVLTVRAQFVIVLQFLRWAQCWHQSNATICRRISKKTIYNICNYLRNMGDLRLPIREIHHFSVYNFWCATGVFHTKPNMGQLADIAFWNGVSNYPKNNIQTYRHYVNI